MYFSKGPRANGHPTSHLHTSYSKAWKLLIVITSQTGHHLLNLFNHCFFLLELACCSEFVCYCFFPLTFGQQAGAWDQYDAKGAPVGSGCRLDMQVLKLGYPHQTIEELVQIYHSKSEEGKQFRASFEAASRVMNARLQAGSLPMILPESSVGYERSFVSEMFYEVAFITESDIAKIWPGMTSKLLRLPKAQQVLLEDGTGNLNGWHMQLWGIDPHVAQCLRRVRVSTKLAVTHGDLLMSPSTQVRPDQGPDVLALALSKQTRLSAEKCSGSVGSPVMV